MQASIDESWTADVEASGTSARESADAVCAGPAWVHGNDATDSADMSSNVQ